MEEKAKKFLIKLEVNEEGKKEIVTYPPRLRVRREKRIKWECDPDTAGGYYFVVNLGHNSPHNEETFQAPPGGTITVQIRSDAPFDEYKYTIVLFNTNGECFIEDPRFIVRP